MSMMRMVTNAHNKMLLKLSALRFLFGEPFFQKCKVVPLINMEEMNSE